MTYPNQWACLVCSIIRRKRIFLVTFASGACTSAIFFGRFLLPTVYFREFNTRATSGRHVDAHRDCLRRDSKLDRFVLFLTTAWEVAGST
jgi:hypothetical protein